MANILETIFTITAGQGKTYFTSSGSVSLDRSYIGASTGVSLYLGNSGTATMNTAGKAILYPKTGVSPFKADILVSAGGGAQGKNLKIAIDGTTIVDQDITSTDTYGSETHEHFNLVNSTIINSTQNSSIVFTLTATSNGLFQAYTIDGTYIKLYFQQWDLVGYSTGDGVQAVMSPGRVYNGETVTFSTLLNDNSIFHGWYSDAAHTQLVSTNQTYTVTASEDLVLYAYATKKPDKYNNKLYIKGKISNSKWKHPYSVYKKTINGWELQTDVNAINKTYFYYDTSVVHDLTNTTYRVTANVRANPQIVYILNNNLVDRPFTSISSSTSFHFVPLEEGLALVYNGNYNSTTQTLTVKWYALSDFQVRTMTVNATLQTYTQEIYFIDKDGNNFTETKISNEAYTVTTPSGYTNFLGWQEFYNNAPTGRVLEVGKSYYDVGSNKSIHYEPVFST